jgi:hypothetical protein
LTKYTYETTYFNAWYDVAGTYKWVFWNDTDDSGTINGSEYSEVFTVVAADGTAALTATIAPFNSTSGAASTNGTLVKITLTDAAGNPANVDSAGGVKATVSGSAIITTGSNTTSSYIIPRESFNGAGSAWINVTNATAEIVTLSVAGVGSTTVTGTAKSLTFTTATGATSGQVAKGSATTAMSAVASNAATFGIGKSMTFETNATASETAADKDDVHVSDTFGIITGKAGAAYSLAVSPCTAATTYCGTFSVATGGAVEGQTFTVTLNAGTAVTMTSAASSATGGSTNVLVAGSSTYSAAETLILAKLSSTTVTLRARDQFSQGRPSVSMSATLSSTSRNYGQSLASVYTGSAGTASFTFTDANTAAGTSLTDVITFSDGTNSATLTISYADADLGISTMVMDTNDTDADGVNLATITPVAISTGNGTEGGRSAVTVTLKNSAGTLLNGVPVTWTVAGGSGVALYLPSGMTAYTTAGVATAHVYAWVAGTYTVTATAGSTSVTEQITFASTTNTNARIISATVKDNVVTGKAVDRFGNPVKNVVILATTTGGYFGSGVTSTQGTTGSNGTVDFVLVGKSGNVTISVDGATYTQTTAIAGSADNTADGEYDATVAATSTAAAYYVGTALAPAGVNSVTVAVTVGADAATVAAEAATDAAAEAIDAANAATDAANLAAEAADAATVAAEEARDAADAATAAVEELATQVATLMAALKAQITTLANTVAKIAKKVKA